MTYIKRSGGGVALRATFAALIALGSIPGAAAVSPNFSNVAFAATRGANEYQFPDKYINELKTAADWKIRGYISTDKYTPSSCSTYCSSDRFRVMNSDSFKICLLRYLKQQLNSNTNKKEIPITCAYKDIEPALTDPDKFYELYKNVTDKPSIYGFSDATKFKEFITSKPSNDTDVFLRDATAAMFPDSNTVESYPVIVNGVKTVRFSVCKITSEFQGPYECVSYNEIDKRYEKDYWKYLNYWANVLSGIRDESGNLDKTRSFAYGAPSGCMLPYILQDESERLYIVDGKPKYLVQATADIYEKFQNETMYGGDQERFSYELPLHTIAKFVKDVTIPTPDKKVPVNDQSKLTDPELQEIRAKYKTAFIEALKNEIKENKIKTLVDRGTFKQEGTNIVIRVPGIKTQVIPVTEITITLDAAKQEATNTINALPNLTDDSRAPYLDSVDSATTIDAINQAVKEAQAADAASAEANTARDKLNEIITKALNMQVEDLSYLFASEDKKSTFNTALSDAQAAVADPTKSAAELTSCNDALAAAMRKLDGNKNVLDKKKAEALAKLKNYGISDDEQDNPYRKIINNARKPDTITNVFIILSKQLLGKVIRSANELKTNADVKYTQASKDKKELFDKQLDVAIELYKNNKYEKTDATLDKLDGARDGLSKAMNDLDGVAQAQLANKKSEANNLLKDYGLSDEDKRKFEDKIKGAQSETDVDQLLKDAKLTGAKTKAVQAVTDAATQKKQELLTNQGTSTKDEVEAAQKEVGQFADEAIKKIKAVKTGETEDAVNAIKDEAIGKINGVVAKNAAKDKAKTTIQNLTHLDQNEKTTYYDQVDKATDQNEIDKAVKDAQAADLAKVKDTAKNTINNDLKFLEPNQKTTYTGQVDKAANEAAVNTVVKNAQAADLANATAAKADAKKTINGLQNLEKKDKDDFCGKVDQASDKAGVDKVVEDAKLADAKAKALKDIDKMNLTPEQKKDAKQAVNDAKDTDSVTNAVNDAKDKQPKQDLSAAKADAKKTINGLQNLEKKDKDDFCGKVDQASDKAGVDKVVEDAKLADAKAKALKDIDKMNLTPEQKKDAKQAVNDAKDTDSVTNAVNDAKDKQPTQQEHVYVYDAGDIAESEAANATTMLYRLYNKWTHEHLFTTDKDEYDTLVAAGWTGEENAGMVAVNQGKGVYRLYNPNTGEHHYTTDENELAACVKAGWVNEGIKFHSVQNGTVSVYSMYNPYEKKFYHHYTSDPDEIAKMVKAGWVKEEIKWYAAK